MVNNLYDIKDPLKKFRWNLLRESGFYEVPGAEAKHCIIGMLYALSANIESSEGLWKAIEFQMSSPFISLDRKHVPASLDRTWDAFLEYMAQLSACLVKLPELTVSIGDTAVQAAKLPLTVSGEIASLDYLGKAKAAYRLSLNIKGLSKVPKLAKDTTSKLKTTMGDIKDAIQAMKSKGDELDKIGADCKANGKLTPLDCFKFKEKAIPYPTGEKLLRFKQRMAAQKNLG